MARIRTIKPEFFTDPDLVACSPLARILFAGMWCYADDYGVLKDEPERIRLQVLPGDNVDADALVAELVERTSVERRVAGDGTNVLFIRKFSVHQKIDKRGAARYGTPETFDPPPPAGSPPIPPDPAESPRIPPSPPESLPIPPDPAQSPPWKGKERKGREGRSLQTSTSTALVLVEPPTVSPPATDPVQVVFDAWQQSTGKHRARLDPKRRRTIRAALGTYDVDELLLAVDGWRHSTFHAAGTKNGGKPYNDLGLVLRDAAHIEQFIGYARAGPVFSEVAHDAKRWAERGAS